MSLNSHQNHRLDNADFSPFRQGEPKWVPAFQSINKLTGWPRVCRPSLSCFFHSGPLASGLSHGEPSPICWNIPSQAVSIMVWVASSPACCCCKKATMSVIVHNIPPHASPFVGEGGITSEADSLERVGENGGRKKCSGCQLGKAMFQPGHIVPTIFL